jgi:GT2 family glycosyltransferase
MKIIAVIVTYNRLLLLQKCIAALKAQTRPVDAILVVNNSSTDGTEEWLTATGTDFITQANHGGAAGFNEGLKQAYYRGADWTWLMDDDTIPYPDALKYLAHCYERCHSNGLQVGFYASLVLWTNGQPHLMNETSPYKGAFLEPYSNLPEDQPCQLITGATFVSILIARVAVEKVGLPIKEFFIWSDDMEYTRRIVQTGLLGVLVKDSIAIHETPTNYKNDIFEDGPENLWKYGYGLRNELYIRRHYKGEFSFWRNVAKRLFILPVTVLRKRKKHKWKFIKVIWRSSLAAIHFRPPVEKLPSKEP